MRSRNTEVLGSKLQLGQFRIPIWTIVVTVTLALAFAAASGQVGKALTGETVGAVELVVEQAIILDTNLPIGQNPTVVFPTGVGDSASTRNDEGTSFRVAIEMHQGQVAYVTLFLDNRAGEGIDDAGSAVLELQVPDDININVSEAWQSDLSEAQMGPDRWLIVVPGGTGSGDRNNGLQIAIKPKDVIKPGFYSITGRIIQIEGG